MSLPPPVPDNRPFAERLRQAEAAIVERDLRVRHCWEQARAQTHERTQAVASWGARAGAALLGWWVVRRLRRYRRLPAAQGWWPARLRRPPAQPGRAAPAGVVVVAQDAGPGTVVGGRARRLELVAAAGPATAPGTSRRDVTRDPTR